MPSGLSHPASSHRRVASSEALQGDSYLHNALIGETEDETAGPPVIYWMGRSAVFGIIDEQLIAVDLRRAEEVGVETIGWSVLHVATIAPTAIMLSVTSME